MKKLVFHIHTEKSHDSRIKIKDLINYLIKNKIDYFCVADHNTFEACEIIEKELKKKEYRKIKLIRGMEIKTEYGHIISCFIQKEIKSKRFLEVVKETKKQKGLLIIPHPFVKHRKLDYLIGYADGIEVFNSSSSIAQNKKAKILATKYPKLIKIAAADAHSIEDLLDSVNEIKIRRKTEIRPIICKSSGYLNSKLTRLKNDILNILEKIIKHG